MLTFTIRESAPPSATIVFDQNLRVFSTWDLTEAEPEENSFAMFFVTTETAHINVPVRVDFHAISVSLIVSKRAFIKSAI